MSVGRYFKHRRDQVLQDEPQVAIVRNAAEALGEMHPKLQEVHDALPAHGRTLASLQATIDSLEALAEARGKVANANMLTRRAAEAALGDCRAEIAKLYESIGRRDS